MFDGLTLGYANLMQAWDVDVTSYDYPLTNPSEVTIVATLLELCPELPYSEDIGQKGYSLELRLEREFVLSDNFWSAEKLRCHLTR